VNKDVQNLKKQSENRWR